MSQTMTHDTTERPEPGIATDHELSEALDAASEAIHDHYLEDRMDGRDVYARRFSPDRYGVHEWDETIVVKVAHHVEDKTKVINCLLRSDAPVELRGLERDGEHELTLYPTNQEG